MCNVVTKSIIIICILLSIASCGNTNKEKAQILIAEANIALEEGNFNYAISLLDSLDKNYPQEIESRRLAMNIRPRAIEKSVIKEIEQNDSLLIELQQQKAQLDNLFNFINNSQLVEGYYIAKADKSKIMTDNGIQARIEPNGNLYIISTLIGKRCNHNSFSLTINNEKASTLSVENNNDRNYKSGIVESVTFILDECQSVCDLIEKYPNQKGSITFIGNNNHTISLNTQQINNIANTYKYSKILSNINKAISNRYLLEQKLQLARDQFARTLQENTPTK